MASFTPPLGSSSPAVLADNASRLDKLLNSPVLTVPDRSGESLKSWAGITAGIDAIISSLDTGSFTFPDISTGLAAIANGQYFRVPQGVASNNSFIYYRKVSGTATIVAVARGYEIYGTRITPTTNLDSLPGGMYYLIQPDLSSLVVAGNFVSLGYPADIVSLGSATVEVIREGTNPYSYQNLSFPSQGVTYSRGLAADAQSSWTRTAGPRELTLTTSLKDLDSGPYYARAFVLAQIVAAGNLSALGYPMDLTGNSSAHLFVTTTPATKVAQIQTLMVADGNVYSRQKLSDGTYSAWINSGDIPYKKSVAYADATFARAAADTTNYFPASKFETNPNYVSNASHWQYVGAKEKIMLTNPVNVSAYVGWQYALGNTPASIRLSGTGYKLLASGSFSIRLRLLSTDTTGGGGDPGVIQTIDIAPVLSNGLWSFKSDVISVPAACKFLRVTVVIPTLAAVTQLEIPADSFMHIILGAQNSVDDIVDQHLTEVLPPIIESEVEKQIEDGLSGTIAAEVTRQIGLASGGLADYIQKGNVILRNDGSIRDVLADYTFCSWWGSSTMERMASQFAAMFTSFSVTNQFAGGKGGEIWQQHAARMGAIPAKVIVPGGVIPASGSIPVDITNFPTQRRNYLKTYAGTLNGVAGNLAYSAGSTTFYTFTRAAAGATVTVSSSTEFDFIPSYNRKYVQGYTILNVGKNNFAEAIATPREVLEATISMYNFVKPMFKRVILINHYGNTDETASSLADIKSYNALLSDQFGNLVIDNYSYLMGAQVWSDTGISPTATDLAAQSRGAIAPSLSSDGIHMNTPVSQLVIDKLIQPRLSQLWFS